jgi:hypothetical protein
MIICALLEELPKEKAARKREVMGGKTRSSVLRVKLKLVNRRAWRYDNVQGMLESRETGRSAGKKEERNYLNVDILTTACVRVHDFVCVCVHICVGTWVHVCACVYIYVSSCVSVCVSTYMCVLESVYIRTCVGVWVCE